MSRFRFPRTVLMAGMGLLVIGLPVLAEELRGTVKSVDRVNSRMVVHDEMAQRDVVVNFNKLDGAEVEGQQPVRPQGREARRAYLDHGFGHRVPGHGGRRRAPTEQRARAESMLAEFWYNFRHNLFKPLLLFFYLGSWSRSCGSTSSSPTSCTRG